MENLQDKTGIVIINEERVKWHVVKDRGLNLIRFENHKIDIPASETTITAIETFQLAIIEDAQGNDVVLPISTLTEVMSIIKLLVEEQDKELAELMNLNNK